MSPPSILALPVEIRDPIMRNLRAIDPTAIRTLSFTCSFFRDLFAQELLQDVILRNRDDSAASLHALSLSPRRRHVKQLHFLGHATVGLNIDSDYGLPQLEPVLPLKCKEVLTHLHRFPNLEKVIIELVFDFSAFYPDDFFQEREVVETTQEMERRFSWRALPAQTYAALGQNCRTRLDSLELRNLVPKEVSTLKTPAFRKFLAQVGGFKISICDAIAEDGQVWSKEGPRAFFCCLDSLFFNHLISASKFELRADKGTPLGLQDTLTVPSTPLHYRLPLLSRQMRHIKSLVVERVFICSTLLEFITGNKSVLESVVLDNCYSSAGPMQAPNGIEWGSFFDDIHKSLPEHLVIFSCLPILIPYTMTQREASQSFPEIGRALDENPKRRIFDYTHLDDKGYGLICDFGKRRESFQDGADQAGYDKLMELVEANVIRDNVALLCSDFILHSNRANPGSVC